MLLVFLWISLVLLVLAVLAATKGSGLAAVSWLSWGVLGFFILIPILPLVLIVQVLGLAVLATACHLLGNRIRLYVASSIAATVALWAAFIVQAELRIRDVNRLRAEHPYQSLAARLAYESPGTAGHATGSRPAEAADESSVERLIEPDLPRFVAALDGGWPARQRSAALRALHSRSSERFIRSAGFGVTRMSGPDRNPERYVELPPDRPIALPRVPERPSWLDGRDARGLDVLNQPLANPPRHQVLEDMHFDSYADFVNSEGFGHVSGPRLAAGFQPHHFRRLPELGADESDHQPWLLVGLELISLLKSEPPAVYVSDHLPRMSELQDAPTRPLDEFEHAALGELNRGEDLLVEQEPSKIRMLGALRSVEQCLDCHQVREGDLLGAFSYELIATD
jgi:hypothetical protein